MDILNVGSAVDKAVETVLAEAVAKKLHIVGAQLIYYNGHHKLLPSLGGRNL